jgi:hypothetical protein
MGLDGVELVMELENEFGITIPDSEASRITTVGQTVSYIVRLLWDQRPREPWVCPSSRLFYQLRDSLGAIYGIARSAVRPSVRIGDLVTSRMGRGEWNDVAATSGLRREGSRWLHPFAPRFPPPEMTVRDLIHTRAAPPKLGGPTWLFFKQDGSVNEPIVYEYVVRLVCEQLGVSRSRVGRDTHYVNDLHMD